MKNILFIVIALMAACAIHAQDMTGSWQGDLDIGGQKLGIVFKFSKTAEGTDLAKMDVPAQGAADIPLTIAYISKDSLSLEMKKLNMAYTGRIEGELIKGTFLQNGMSLPLELKQGKPAPPNRPQTPKKPYPYQTQEVTFSNVPAHVTLAGTLTYPTDYKPGKHVPVVLMVTGSGAQKRDEGIFDHNPFLVIADYLARNGIASLRYDDRGVGQSTGSFKGSTTKDFAQDAEAGIVYLRKSKQFGSVGILGHSEGGLIAFMLGAEKAVDFIVSMAGPALQGDSIIAEQTNAMLRYYGKPANQTVAKVHEAIVNGPKDAWQDYFINCDPTPYIRQITVPLMAINGSKDHQVLPDSNLKKIEALQKSGNKKNLIKEYPGLNHLFQHCESGMGDEYWKIEETISPEVLSDIAAWIHRL